MTPPVSALPSALADVASIQARLAERPPALFVDYDGTLTPIASRPDMARIGDPERALLSGLAEHCPVAIVTGRDLADIRARVGLPQLYYAGSHGFDIAGPDLRHRPDPALAPLFVKLADTLRPVVERTPGAILELKAASVSVHYRLVDPRSVPTLESAIDEAIAGEPRIQKMLGKKIFELRPTLPWHKGAAVRWLLDRFVQAHGLRTPVFLGDDRTDEDALAEIEHEGVGILVGEGGDGQTHAHWHLQDPAEVHRFLDTLLAWLARPTPQPR